MPVETPSAYYEAMLPKWTRCRDAAEGSGAVKAKKTAYLPMVNVNAQSADQYDEYLFRAMWFPATGRTITGLVGAVFQKPPTVKVPLAIEDHTRDITQAGEDLEQYARLTMVENMTTGRYGILVDMAAEGGIPYWLRYRAEDILSVRRERMKGAETLTLVVLQEAADLQGDDEFVTKQTDQIRVLDFVGGKYRVRLYRRKDQEKNEGEYVEFIPANQDSHEAIPLRRGEPLPFIPFVLPDDKKPPLQDLVEVNYSHYLGKADHQNILHWVGYPFLWGRDLKAPEGEAIKAGPSRLMETGPDGHVGIIQATAEGVGAMVADLDSKEKTMAMLGARLLEEQPRIQDTATATRMRHGGEHATLRTEAGSVEADLSRALQMHAWWYGTEANLSDVEATVELNKDFLPEPMNPQMLQQLLAALMSDSMSFPQFYYLLERGEMTRPGVSAEEELAAIRVGGGGAPAPLDVGGSGALLTEGNAR